MEGVGDDTETTSVTNKINVMSNTGGNTVEPGGTIEEGKEEVSVQIETVVNGESVDPVDIKTEGVSVEVKTKVEVKDAEVSMERDIKIGEDIEESIEDAKSTILDGDIISKEENKSFNENQEERKNFGGFIRSLFQKLFSFFS